MKICAIQTGPGTVEPVERPTDLDQVPVGTYALLTPASDAPVVLLNADRYEVGDGDLIVTSKKGNTRRFKAGEWLGIGTIERDDEGGSYIALERHADATE